MAAPTKKAVEPVHIVLDTNVFIRLLIHEYLVKDGGFFSMLASATCKLWIAPHQEHEIFRNLRGVFEEHCRILEKGVKAARDAFNETTSTLEIAQVFKVWSAEDWKLFSKAKTAIDGIKAPRPSYDELEALAEKAVNAANRPEDVGALVGKAQARVDLHNPPCVDSKARHNGDCLLWELVLHLLAQGHVVWFNTTDRDFCFPNTRELHPFLSRESRAHKKRLTFLVDEPRSHKPFPILAEVSSRVAALSSSAKSGVEASGPLRSLENERVELESIRLGSFLNLNHLAGSAMPVGAWSSMGQQTSFEAALRALHHSSLGGSISSLQSEWGTSGLGKTISEFLKASEQAGLTKNMQELAYVVAQAQKQAGLTETVQGLAGVVAQAQKQAGLTEDVQGLAGVVAQAQKQAGLTETVQGLAGLVAQAQKQAGPTKTAQLAVDALAQVRAEAGSERGRHAGQRARKQQPKKRKKKEP